MPRAHGGLEMQPLTPDESEARFRKGLAQFNRGQFFAAHETWEEIWLPAAEPEKTFLQGLIQVAAAFHHYARGNRVGTQSLLAAGLRKLERFPPSHRGLKLEELRKAVRRWLSAVEAGKSPSRAKFPQINFFMPGHSRKVLTKN